MINLTGNIRKILDKNVKEILQGKIVDSSKSIIGWNTKVIDKAENLMGGGIHKDKEISFNISLSETIEILERKFLLSNEELKKYCFDIIPTRCGLAAGFQRDQTQLRSYAEGLERWIWSQWIDKRMRMEKIELAEFHRSMNPLAAYYFSYFDKVDFFKKSFVILINNKMHSFEFGAVIGFKNGGAFPCSRVGFYGDDLWTHSLIESYRHLHIFKNITGRTDQLLNIIDRIKYFGNNSESVLDQIDGTNDNWPKPQVDFSFQIRSGEEGYFLYRTLFKNYMPWHQGDQYRFIF